jgi:hypothetical protein
MSGKAGNCEMRLSTPALYVSLLEIFIAGSRRAHLGRHTFRLFCEERNGVNMVAQSPACLIRPPVLSFVIGMVTFLKPWADSRRDGRAPCLKMTITFRESAEGNGPGLQVRFHTDVWFCGGLAVLRP